MDFSFKNSFRFTQNGSWNSLKHPFPLLTDYPIINILHYCGTFVTTDEQISISLCSTVLWILTNGIHHYSITQFHRSKNPLSSPVHPYPALPPSTLPSPCNYWSFYCVYHFAFSECHGWNHAVGSFSEWLLSLGNIYLWFRHAFYGLITHFFLSRNNISSYGIYHNLFIHSSVEKHLSYFQFWEIANKASTNTHVQILVWTYIFTSIG